MLDMRISILATVAWALATIVVAGTAQAQIACDCQQSDPCQQSDFCDGGCGLFGCHGHHGHHGHHHRATYEGLGPGANCGCNGSYNYPVPPLYTYHWPGLYKQVRVTDYHSPWRFPPIKPYTDEAPLTPFGSSAAVSRVLQTSAFTAVQVDSRRAGDVTPMSRRLQAASR
jgi:hypothetical protein